MREKFLEAVDILRREGPASFARKSSAFLFWRSAGHAFIRLAARNFRRKAATATDTKSAVSLAFDYSFLGLRIEPLQVREEIEELVTELAPRKPRTVMEIGTARGGTLFLFSRVASDDAKLISLDLPGGKYGGGYPAPKAHLYRSFARGSQEIHLLRADSHEESTRETVARIVGEGRIDFLFIDGDHTYDGVKRDFEMYFPLVSKEGMIALHDILHHTANPEVGVDRFWGEIKGSYDSHEIVSDRAQGWAGIGVIVVC
jgi:predicted O-methyltransferase YrrM